MKNVFLDGEEVLFEGPHPQDMPSLEALLTQHAQNNDRVLTQWIVNGIDLLKNPNSKTPTQVTKIEVFSEKHEKVLFNLINDTLSEGPSTLKLIDNYSHTLLSHPWKDQAPLLGTVIEKLMPVIELLGHLETYGKEHNHAWCPLLSEILESFNSQIEQLTNYTQQNNIAALSEQFSTQLIPLIQQTLNILKNNIQSTLTNNTRAPQ